MGRKRSNDRRTPTKQAESSKQKKWRLEQLAEKRKFRTLTPKNYREFEKLQSEVKADMEWSINDR